MNSDPAFVLLTQHSVFLDRLISFLEKEKIKIIKYRTIQEWRTSESKDTINGIFIDLKNLMTSDHEDRNWFHQVESVFPILILMPHHTDNFLKIIHQNETVETEEQLENLLKKIVQKNPRRTYREHIRYDRYYRIQLTKQGEKQKLQGFISNISITGVFVVLNCGEESIQAEQNVRIQFVDIEGKPSIHGNVRFVRSWADAKKQPPGFGIQIVDEDLLFLSKLLLFKVS